MSTTVTVAQWEALLRNGDASGCYIIDDTAENIAGLPASDINNQITEIKSNNSTLVLNLAQAVALLNLDEAGNPTAPFIILNAPDGEVILADTLANLETYSSQFYETLKTTGIEAIGIAETAENIQELSEAQLQAASALGVTLISATDTGVQLSTAEAINFENGGSFQIAVPTNDSVIVIDSGDNLQNSVPQRDPRAAAARRNRNPRLRNSRRIHHGPVGCNGRGVGFPKRVWVHSHIDFHACQCRGQSGWA